MAPSASLMGCAHPQGAPGDVDDPGDNHDSVVVEPRPRLRSLYTRIDDTSLLRAISVTTMLQRGGSAFATSSGGISVTLSDYQQSFETLQFDDFISHDWKSGRLQKTIALLFVYNSRAAVISSLVAAPIVVTLQLDDVGLLRRAALHDMENSGGTHKVAFGVWCTMVCPLVFVFFLIFWHRIKEVVVRRRIFLDKFCVDQVNEERKTAAIMSLAGFLAKSKRLVVCWTPRYFTRLWCVYEIVTWLHLQKREGGNQESALYFVPLSQVMIVVLPVPVLSLLYFIGSLLTKVQIPYIFVILTLSSLALLIYHVSKMICDLGDLPVQISKFEIQRSQCYCCTNNHVDPITNKPLPCDRLLVYDTLRDWSRSDFQTDAGEKAKIEHKALEAFDRSVREEFGIHVLRKAGPTHIPYKSLQFSLVPIQWYACDVLAALGTVELAPLLREAIFEYVIVGLLGLPLLLKILFYIMVKINQRTHQVQRKVIVFLCVIIGWVLLLMIWRPLVFLNNFESWLPVASYSLVLLFANIWFFRKRVW